MKSQTSPAAGKRAETPFRRLVLFGRRSFIAHHLFTAAKAHGGEALYVSPDDEPNSAIEEGDVVINCRISPEYKLSAYTDADDFDLAAARLAKSAGAKFVMLSTRKVYDQNHLWDVHESEIARGDGSHYGNNKAVSESGVKDLHGEAALIFRLSNVFGFEYVAGRRRDTFFGRMLSSLRGTGTIEFDMSSSTRRDFLPVTRCAEAIVFGAYNGISGTYNLGCGLPMACGELAERLIEGYGSGKLIVQEDKERDEFYLNVDKWRRCCQGWNVSLDDVRGYCFGLGQRLKDA